MDFNNLDIGIAELMERLGKLSRIYGDKSCRKIINQSDNGITAFSVADAVVFSYPITVYANNELLRLFIDFSVNGS
jgi:FMN-dependent NADH-azoreductase